MHADHVALPHRLEHHDCLDGLRRPNHEKTSIQAFCFFFLQPHIEFNKRLMIPLGGQGEEMTKLIAILLLAFAFGCLPPVSRRSCSELEADMSVSLAEFYSHCRAHSRTD